MLCLRRRVLALGLAALAGCLPSSARAEEPEASLSRAIEPEAASTRRVIFICPKDTLLTVEFLNTEPGKPAVIRPPTGPAITLPAHESGSGFRYADGTHELLGKGREVTWTDPSQSPIVCTEQTPTPGGTEPN